MRIVFISDWFAEKMGYVENCLPKAMASLGHEIHVITSNVQPYFNFPIYKAAYEPFIGPGIVDCEIKEVDGYTLHRLPFNKLRGRLRIKGLLRKLIDIRPQIVQTFSIPALTTCEAVLAKPFLGYKLFLESHEHASVSRFATQWGELGRKERFLWITVFLVGRIMSFFSEKCYPISTDAADIVVRIFGIQPRKVSICSLGVDTDLFSPVVDESSKKMRLQLRQQLGFAESDIVCIYTGRFSSDKNPLCLAKSIAELAAQGEQYRGLFIGSGSQEDMEAIQAYPGCVVHPFVPYRELPTFYRAADIAVWPKQESTSQLDAAACGLPLILSNRVKVLERIDGNGLVYQEGDPHDLASKLRILFNPAIRQKMGEYGVRKMREQFSWKRIAEQRVQDYKVAALKLNSS